VRPPRGGLRRQQRPLPVQLTLFSDPPATRPSGLPSLDRPNNPARPLTYPSYDDYLRSPRWQELRESALERDGHRCRFCNRNFRLAVHHRKYPEILGTEELEDLVTLCAGCHAVFRWFRSLDNDPMARMARLRRR
jgi:hypothetical protein